MVNANLTREGDAIRQVRAAEAELALILSYSPDAAARGALAALLDLDAALADVLRASRDAMLVQMRLTWWHQALCRLDESPAPAMPVLTVLADRIVPLGVRGTELAALVEGWETLGEGDPADPSVRSAYARQRGALLFALAARLSGNPDFATGDAGRGWALADLSRKLSDPVAAQAARAEAGEALAAALGQRWPRSLRSLGALAHRSAMDLGVAPAMPLPAATPRRVARLAWHRLTGR
ncbi:hypothetical protein [Sphingomonas sp. 37zxx]|uniref:hypothetical protein n=1 Tax=Sphingomonas sp. 37zxx TaxID=1550073 RepID=UPI00068E2D65|nr:hypothetical protein [Sphingomonas sp. 37zxx]